MANRGTPDRVDEQAADWAARTVSRLDDENQAELDAWLNEDRRHRGAYLRARAALYAMEGAVRAGNGQSDARNGHASEGMVPPAAMPAAANDDRLGGFDRWRNRIVAGGMTLAACVALFIATGYDRGSPPDGAVADNSAAEGTVLRLEDGSIVTLSAGADVEVSMVADIRRITLMSGAATFQVAKDKSRPFVVQSGDVYAQATGTVYTVRRFGKTGGAVDVREGAVLVWAGGEREHAVLLHAGGSLTLNPGERFVDVGKQKPHVQRRTEPSPNLAQIALDDTSIAEAAERFNRINNRQIMVADPAIGDIRIMGLFRADDPEGFARAAAAVSGATLSGDEGVIVIKKK